MRDSNAPIVRNSFFFIFVRPFLPSFKKILALYSRYTSSCYVTLLCARATHATDIELKEKKKERTRRAKCVEINQL